MVTSPASGPGVSYKGGPSVVLARNAAVDVHAAGIHAFAPDAAFDNLADFNALTSLPAGLGFTVAIDGTSATLTFTESGIWAYAMLLNLGGAADATFEAQMKLSNVDSLPLILGPGLTALEAGTIGFAATVRIPSGGAGAFRVITTIAATTNPYDATMLMPVMRLA